METKSYPVEVLKPFDLELLEVQQTADRKGFCIEDDEEYVEACYLLTQATGDGVTSLGLVRMMELVHACCVRYLD